MVTVLAQLATHASRAIARAARMETLGNLRRVLATPCQLLSLRLFYEAKMVTVLAQLNAHASYAIARDCACCMYRKSVKLAWNLGNLIPVAHAYFHPNPSLVTATFPLTSVNKCYPLRSYGNLICLHSFVLLVRLRALCASEC